MNRSDESLIKDRIYDIVIIGGGMVGASLALQLSHHSDDHLKILLVESFPLLGIGDTVDYSPSFDARSTALSFGSRKIFEPLGIWPDIDAHAAPIHSIHVSDKGHLGSATMRRSDAGWPSLGHVVENAWLGKVLLTALRKKSNVEFCSPASVSSISPLKNGVAIEIDFRDGKSPGTSAGADSKGFTVNAQLAVIADGANSGMRASLGINTKRRDYAQTALIANVSVSKSHEQIAYERFTEQGPMALLPLTASEQGHWRYALVWTMAEDRAETLLSCEPQLFLSELQKHFGSRQGEFVRVGKRFTYPLELIEASEQVRSGIVLVGNAAHSLHPVAGQGFNLALRDCARLVSVLMKALASRRPLGDLSVLQEYLTLQQFDQRKTTLFSDRVTDLFASKNWSLSTLRGLGLSVMDILPGAKKAFISHAAGLHDGAAGAVESDATVK